MRQISLWELTKILTAVENYQMIFDFKMNIFTILNILIVNILNEKLPTDCESGGWLSLLYDLSRKLIYRLIYEI